MSSKGNHLLNHNSIFLWIAAGCGLILLVPLTAMQFTMEVQWSLSDFLVMGCLLFFSSSLFVMVARKTKPQRRWVVGLFFAAVFLFVWAELAVGIFTNLGS